MALAIREEAWRAATRLSVFRRHRRSESLSKELAFAVELPLLLRRTLRVRIRAVHAAIAGLRAKERSALFAFVVVLTRVDGHRLRFVMTARRTSDRCRQYDAIHLGPRVWHRHRLAGLGRGDRDRGVNLTAARSVIVHRWPRYRDRTQIPRIKVYSCGNSSRRTAGANLTAFGVLLFRDAIARRNRRIRRAGRPACSASPAARCTASARRRRKWPR